MCRRLGAQDVKTKRTRRGEHKICRVLDCYTVVDPTAASYKSCICSSCVNKPLVMVEGVLKSYCGKCKRLHLPDEFKSEKKNKVMKICKVSFCLRPGIRAFVRPNPVRR